LVEALRYKPEGRGFDSRSCHWKFSLIKSFRPQYSPGVDSASNINEYQEYFLGRKGDRCLGADNLTTSMCRLSGKLGVSTTWNPRDLSRDVMGLLYLCNWVVTRWHYTFTHKQYIEQHKQQQNNTNTCNNQCGRVRAVPRLCEFYPNICLTTEGKHKNTSVRVRKTRMHMFI